MKIQIKNRFTFNVMFEIDADSIGDAVKKLIGDNCKADLSEADLSEADLRGANLREANLRGANLRRADLREADLREANLRRADLRRANLREADLREANLRRANLREADLSEANLREADLRGANLRRADLSEADLRGANLWGCIGNMLQIKSAQICKYAIAWTAEYMQIGCKRFKIGEWFGFSDETISTFDSGALKWWLENKDFVKLMIEKNPAEKTGHESD